MPEPQICYGVLQDQRKAVIESYLFSMGMITVAVLPDVDDVEKFMDTVRDSVIPTSGLLKGYIRSVEETYPHVAIPAYPDWSKGTTYSVKCQHCNMSLGWHCPDNPNGYCEYDYERTGQDREWCIHCGAPEERK